MNGPAWFITPSGIAAGVQGVGTTSSYTIAIYNISKNTPLQVNSVRPQGPNASDFTVDAASALSTVLPPKQAAYSTIKVTFSPAAEGARSASIEIMSNAGSATVQLSGQGAPDRPVAAVDPQAPINLTPASAPYTLNLSNAGGEALLLQHMTITGPDASAFEIVPTSRKFSGCAEGLSLPPGVASFCYVRVGVVSGAAGAKKADLVLQTNDPVNPSIDIPISLASQ